MGRYVTQGGVVKKSSIFIITIALLWLTYESINWYVYRHISVSNHSELMKKASYGQITHDDLRFGAYDLVENSLCLMLSEELTEQCISQFQATKEKCSVEILDVANLDGFGKNETHELLRQFNLCRQSSV
jgi:hypothetical protein